jgi:predicted ATP-dependent serine protease
MFIMKETIEKTIDNCTGPALTLDCMSAKLEGLPEPPRIFRGIIRPSLGCFFGPSKSGKTTLVENLAFSIAAGLTRFLNDDLNCDNRRVLLVSLEEYYRSRTVRNVRQMEAFTSKYNLDPTWSENVYVVDDSFARYITTEEQWELLDAEIERVKPGFVMIDSVTRTTTDSIEDSAVSTSLMKRFREMAHKHNIALVLIHHSQKMDDRPITIATMAGSRVIGQEMDFMIGVNRSTQNIRYLKDVAYRYWPDDSEFVLKFSIDSNQMIVAEEEVYESDILSSSSTANETFGSDITLQTHFSELTNGDPLILIKTADLYARLVNTGIMTRPTLHAALKRLEKNGIIIKPEKGNYKLNLPS